ncbi:response regulator receiver domain [Candidatus Poriferisodalis sp.]|uniref:response regulator receiver domain n=1 Tax=Candidatus Poriferisodalis sp. TaxID=3101277 RepID=UPI003C6FDAAE
MVSAHRHSDLQAQSKEVAKAFLQSVVLLDDKVEMSASSTLPAPPTSPQSLVPPEFPGDIAPSAGRSRETFEVRLNAGQVIDAFARIGAVCAVLTTGTDDSYQDRVYSTAMRADIVILDWKLEESTGDSALEIIHRILEADSDTPRLRLVAIYTGEPGIARIADRIEDLLHEICDQDVHMADRCHMATKSLRVVILAKPDTLNDQTRALGAEEVSEDGLADKLLDEFSRLTTGLLPNVAVAGAAAIRDNAHKMLAQFSQDLDAAYLGHRMLLPHPPESEDQLVRALGAEILSILEEAKPGAHADADAIDMWLDEADSELLASPFTFDGNLDARENWRVLLRQGIDADSSRLPKGGKSKLVPSSTEVFTIDQATAELSNRRFAALLNLKTRYVEHAPCLAIGTLVRIEGENPHQYLLCLLPKCDSVRLDSPTRVPFAPLQPHSNRKGQKTLRVVLQLDTDTWVHLELASRLSELEVAVFQPGTNPPGEIVAQHDASGRYIFEDENSRRYIWMAALKDEHAFGIATEVAAALARPGPDDAEWLRQR